MLHAFIELIVTGLGNERTDVLSIEALRNSGEKKE